jgi:hypothetical protein
MHHFLLRLFVELPSHVVFATDPTMKRFYMSVMNFVYLLSLRNKKSTDEQLQSTLAQSFETVCDLFTVLDVIHILHDTTNQTPWPKAFLALFQTISAKDLDRLQTYFNESTDLQLLNLMNKKISSNSSVGEILDSLPTESESTAAIYQEYPSLSNIPGECVRTRAKLFYRLSELIERALTTVDLSLSLGQSILADQFHHAKMYLWYVKKSELLQQSLEQTVANNDEYDSRPSVQFDMLKASQPSENGENTMFNQAFEQLFTNASVKFRRSDERLWHATYVGMHSTDAGGPY